MEPRIPLTLLSIRLEEAIFYANIHKKIYFMALPLLLFFIILIKWVLSSLLETYYSLKGTIAPSFHYITELGISPFGLLQETILHWANYKQQKFLAVLKAGEFKFRPLAFRVWWKQFYCSKIATFLLCSYMDKGMEKQVDFCLFVCLK